MKFLHIDPTNKSQMPELVAAIKSGKPVFILFFMEGCGHCVAMRPEWAKLKTAGAGLGKDVTIAAVDSGLLNELSSDSNPTVKKLATIINGFPTIKFVRGTQIVDYNDERTVERFMAFIKSRLGESAAQHGGSGARRHRYRKRHTRRRTGRRRHRSHTHKRSRTYRR